MNFSKVILNSILLTMPIIEGQSQTITYLNGYKFPIQDISKFEPCYFSVESIEGMNTITKVFGIDSLLVSETIVIKNEENEEINKTTIEYRDNESLKSRIEEDFISGHKLAIAYYENGQVEIFEKSIGENIEFGEYFDQKGNPRSKPVQVDPFPKDGMEGWMQYLQKALVFPKDARKRGIEGVVYVVFELTPEGKIENIGVINPEQTHESLVNEAMRVVWKYPYLWTPGMVDEENVRVLMRLPLNFRLK